MDPLLLQKQVRDNADELSRFLDDLKSWEKDMKRKDQELLDGASDNASVPPVRSKIKRPRNTNSVSKSPEQKEEKRISSYDYSAWDKFDVEKACADVDNKEKELEEVDSEPEVSEEDIARSREQAMYEKELGNRHVKEQKWKEAIDCYTRAIHYNQYDAIFYANRALCYLKTKKPKFAETDCTTAIQLDKTYVKAYQRRALAHVDLGHLDDAKADFQKVLELEPNNFAAKNELSKLERRGNINLKRKEEKCMQKATEKNEKPSGSDSKGPASSGDSLREAVVHERLEGAPDVLGAGGDVGIREIVQSLIREEDEEVLPVQKPPHMRSKMPLRVIPVEEVETFADLLWQNTKSEETVAHSSDRKIEVIETIEAEIPPVEDKKSAEESLLDSRLHPNLVKQEHMKEKNAAQVSETSRTPDYRTIDLPPVPKSSVQFFSSWKLVKNNAELRYQFLKQVPGKEFPQIFRDSLESKEFSEIITSLDIDFLERSESVYPYLLGLSQVKRFRALVMFFSKSEKIVIKKLLQYCDEKGECSKEDLSHLLKQYEVN